MMKLPLNPWHDDKHERKVARWYSLAFSESLETLSLAPFSRVFKWPLDRIRHLAAEAKSEAFNKKIHAYNSYTYTKYGSWAAGPIDGPLGGSF